MLEPFEHRGLWWLPEESDERVVLLKDLFSDVPMDLGGVAGVAIQ
jgi:hypothetical protein